MEHILASPIYRHTQNVPPEVFAGVTAAIGAFSLLRRSPLVLWPVVVGAVAYRYSFSSLTVEVDSKQVSFWFASKFLPKHIALEEIEYCEVLHLNPLHGWGIRYLGSGNWLYNVYGLGAVKLVLHSGKEIAIGTDEPETLVGVLKSLGLHSRQ